MNIQFVNKYPGSWPGYINYITRGGCNSFATLLHPNIQVFLHFPKHSTQAGSNKIATKKDLIAQ